ncbi:hypothetical protein SAMN03159496_02950 [Rhizobium sp. NFR07]|nr:hypothetical protein SAMN03159496_02950 [Rhizobium sp. NFR07]
MDKHGDITRGSSDLARRGLWRLMLKLPAMRGRLQILAQKSTVLTDLCEAYEEASMAAERMSREIPHANPSRLAEYQSICSEIETDVVHLVLQKSRNVPD